MSEQHPDYFEAQRLFAIIMPQVREQNLVEWAKMQKHWFHCLEKDPTGRQNLLYVRDLIDMSQDLKF